MLNSQNEKLISSLLEDNELLNTKLNKALELFQEVTSTSTTTTSKQKSQPRRAVNNLQAVNILLTNVISLEINKLNQQRLLNEINEPPSELAARSGGDTSVNRKPKPKTINELIAEEVIQQFEWVKATVQTSPFETGLASSVGDHSDSLDKLELLIKQIKQNRATRFSRLYQPEAVYNCDILLNVCNRCKGEIKTV
jgi:hypothetical protein